VVDAGGDLPHVLLLLCLPLPMLPLLLPGQGQLCAA
jgi:hypothetical protein